LGVRILWASPLPPIRSGVSDYAVELLDELGRVADIRIACPPGWIQPEDWPLGENFELVPATTTADAGEISLVHIGNNPHHLWLIDRLADPLPVVVLHDLVLHHLMVEVWASEGAEGELEEKLVRAHGKAGAALARAREFGLAGGREAFLFPARSLFVANAKGTIVHSRWALDRLRSEFPAMASARVGLPAVDPGSVDRSQERAHLNCADDETILMHLGFLTPEKGLSEVMTGLGAAVRAGVKARLLLVGEGRNVQAVLDAAAAIGLGDHVTATGWLPHDRLLRAPAAADLGVVLRTPSAGETSAAVIRFLACGTPVAVGGLKQFLEWPETAAPRLTPGSSAPADLARLIANAADGTGWDVRGRAAREAYEANHRPSDTARAMLEFLETLPV
jgi:glycosyltransferase involved in cell wall biosynthesis